ncbi:hypothetical protein BHE74_00047448, partial [Ensete ventricosum]
GLLTGRREAGVYVGVVVDVGAEGGAAGLTDGVGAGERGHVASAQALGGERLNELGEAGAWAGEVSVGRALAGGGGVPASQLHGPCWSPELQGIFTAVSHQWTSHIHRLTLPFSEKRRGCGTHQRNTVARGEREDVSARHCGFARGLDVGFDGIDDFKAADGVGVRARVLLAGEGRCVIQKNRSKHFHGIHKKEEEREDPYIDEAVVEEQPEDGRGHPPLLVDGLGHGRPHDALQVGARRAVERRRQLSIGSAGEQDKEAEDEHSVTAEGGGHG